MRKKSIISIILSGITALSTLPVNAQQMDMYVNNQFVVRDLQSIAGFDMLPILDIAGELGFNNSFDGSKIILSNSNKSYTFTVGSASVYDEAGNWYGLDIVPQVMNGSVRVPAKFFQDAMGMSYTWDSVTNTIFLNSESTYNWLINTPEYRNGDIQNKLQGWWFYYNNEPYTSHFSENVFFGNDGSFYSQTWREKCYGTYAIESPSKINVTYDWYYNFAGTTDYVYIGSGSSVYSLRNGKLIHLTTTSDSGDTYTENTEFEHKDSFTDYSTYTF